MPVQADTKELENIFTDWVMARHHCIKSLRNEKGRGGIGWVVVVPKKAVTFIGLFVQPVPAKVQGSVPYLCSNE